MEHEFITPVGKLRVHSIEAGSGDPLVFLHGWSVHAGSSNGVRRMLEQRYHVFSPSHIGFGKSSVLPHKNFSIVDFANVYVEWLQKRELRNITLVGHSLGGAIGQVIAAKATSGIIKRLILIDPLGVRFERSEMQWTWSWLKKETRNLLSAPKKHAQFLVAPFLTHLLSRPKNLFTLSTLSKQLDVQEFAKKIKVPTEIIWGDKDAFIPQTVGEQLQRIIPGSTLNFVSGGHDWPLLEPEKILPYL